MATVSAPKKEFTSHGKQRIEAAIQQRAADEERFWRTVADAIYVTQETTLEDVGQLLGKSKNTVQKYASRYKP